MQRVAVEYATYPTLVGTATMGISVSPPYHTHTHASIVTTPNRIVNTTSDAHRAVGRKQATYDDARQRAIHAGHADRDVGLVQHVLVAQQSVDTCDADVVQPLHLVPSELCKRIVPSSKRPAGDSSLR